MTASIDSLLKRKKWSGEDLGRISIANLATMFKHQLQGEPQVEIIPRARFKDMLETLTEPHEIKTYNNYLKVHEWICRNYNIASGQDQQALKNLFSLINTMTASIAGERIYQYVENLPKIMTEKQYKDYVEQRREEVLRLEDGRSISLSMLIANGIIRYTANIEADLEENNPLKTLKRTLQSQPIEDEHILASYNDKMKRGYYELPDGARSDKLTPEEWKRAILTEEGVEALRYEESLDDKTLDDMPDGLLDIGQEYNKRLYCEACGLEYEQTAKQRFVKKAVWHSYDTPPEGLTKWDILTGKELYIFYPALDPDTTTALDGLEAGVIAFYEDYKEVVEAVLKDIDRFIKGASNVKPEEWGSTFYTWEELEKANLYDFRSCFTNDCFIFADDSRASSNGIAILKGNSPNSFIDSQGYYNPPMATAPIDELGLARYFPEKENYAYELDSLAICTENLLTAYYFTKGFNTALDLFSKYYKLDLEVFKINTANIELRIDAYNGLIYSLYNLINTTTYHEAEELKEKKLTVLRDIVTPIDYKRLAIPEENLIQASKEVVKFTGYEDNILEDLLCYIDADRLREGA